MNGITQPYINGDVSATKTQTANVPPQRFLQSLVLDPDFVREPEFPLAQLVKRPAKFLIALRVHRYVHEPSGASLKYRRSSLNPPDSAFPHNCCTRLSLSPRPAELSRNFPVA